MWLLPGLTLGVKVSARELQYSNHLIRPRQTPSATRAAGSQARGLRGLIGCSQESRSLYRLSQGIMGSWGNLLRKSLIYIK